MKEGLNLLPSVAKFQASKIKLKAQLKLGMNIFLGFWIVLIVIIFGWLWLNNYSLKKAVSKNTIALNKYKSLSTNVVLSQKNKYQAKLVGQVLNERFEYGSLIIKITSLFPKDITMENFEIKSKKQFMIKGSVSGPNMIEVEDKIKDINLGLYSDFSSAELKSVGVGSDGWKFEMEVNLT